MHKYIVLNLKFEMIVRINGDPAAYF